MKQFVGVDIIEIGRVGKAISSWRDHFLNRVYTKNELALCENNISSLAARFAAKEAVIKALGSSFTDSGWKDIEVLSNPDGAPVVQLHGGVLKRAQQLGITDFSISLSHCKEYAIALLVSYA